MKPQRTQRNTLLALWVYSKRISFKHKGKVVGKHKIDFMIEDKVIV